ncbi:competence type IV pilus minor pilin ComGD [Ornithinibacillus sp. 179-J 7C1 HS]|uniref:competence type IV pilus minor pilin ComGD n=1 Tax=Ornithinibacillus sp. 179-J 7C1 HS TaxID=3142384 RepID=UPI0039A12D8B
MSWSTMQKMEQYRHPNQNNQLGYSLVEILVVLSIMAIILSFTVPVTHSLLESKTEKEFFARLQYDILYLQNQSLGVKDEYLRIILYQNSYTLIGQKNEHIERRLPTGWKINTRTLQTISFNQNGSIRRAGTFQINTPKNTYNIVFPIGKGRGYIEKQ